MKAMKKIETRGRPRKADNEKKQFLNFTVPYPVWEKLGKVKGNRSVFIGYVLSKKVSDHLIEQFNAQPEKFKKLLNSPDFL